MTSAADARAANAFLTAGQIAARTQFCEATVRRACARGEIPGATKRFAHVRSHESPTHCGKSILSRAGCCFAKRGKQPKPAIKKAIKNSRKRFANKNLAPAAATQSVCRQTCAAKC